LAEAKPPAASEQRPPRSEAGETPASVTVEPDYSRPRVNETVIDRFSRKIGDWVAWCFLIAAFLTCVEVVSDAFFNSPTVWVHDSTIMLCATAFLVGGAYAMQRNEHIRINVVYDLFSERVRWWCDLITYGLTMVYVGVLSAITGVQAAESIRLIERSGRAWDFPMPMVVRTMLFIGAALLVLQTGSAIFHHIKERHRPV